jgi:hypothetical protein
MSDIERYDARMHPDAAGLSGVTDLFVMFFAWVFFI